MKNIIRKIDNLLYRRQNLNFAKQKLPKEITHKFICDIPYSSITYGKEYFGYISNVKYSKRDPLRIEHRVNILDDFGRHVLVSVDRFSVIEL